MVHVPTARWRLAVGAALGLVGLLLVVLRPPWYGALIALIFLGFAALRGRRDRPRLRFTREGRYLVAIALGVGFAAINTGNNLLYLILGMLLSMIVVSGILSEQTLRRLEVLRELPRRVHAGRPFLTAITLVNTKRALPSFSVQVEDLIATGPLAKKCYFLKVPAGARQQTSYRTELPRRGVWRYEGVRIGTRFPFAFFVKSRRFELSDALVVYPRLHPVSDLSLTARAALGSIVRPRRGQGREFHGLKDYALGDDVRDVHWKRSARQGRLVLREYASQGARRVVLWLNTARPEGADAALDAAFDRCCDLAASLAVHLQQRGFQVEVCVGGRTLPISAEGQGLDAAFHALALAAPTPEPPEPPTTRGAPVVLVTPRASAGLAGGRVDHVVEPD